MIMAQAHIDPEELRNFVSDLEHYLETIEDETNSLKGHFDELGETWNDSKHDQFNEVFDELISALNAFKDNAEEQIPYLNALAEKAEDYLGQ